MDKMRENDYEKPDNGEERPILKCPDLKEGLNKDFVETMEKYDKVLENLKHINVFEARKKGIELEPNTLAFSTLEDDKEYVSFPDYVNKTVKGQTISIFYISKEGFRAIMGLDAEIHFDENGKKTNVIDIPRIFIPMMNTPELGERVSSKEFLDFLSAVSQHIKKGGDIEKIKYDSENKRIIYYK